MCRREDPGRRGIFVLEATVLHDEASKFYDTAIG